MLCAVFGLRNAAIQMVVSERLRAEKQMIFGVFSAPYHCGFLFSLETFFCQNERAALIMMMWFPTICDLITDVFECLFSSVPLWFPFVAGDVFGPKREGRADHDDVVSDNLRLNVSVLRREAIGVSISGANLELFGRPCGDGDDVVSDISRYEVAGPFVVLLEMLA